VINSWYKETVDKYLSLLILKKSVNSGAGNITGFNVVNFMTGGESR
jgi:hypothetical protein